jgi:hypothetical protein
LGWQFEENWQMVKVLGNFGRIKNCNSPQNQQKVKDQTLHQWISKQISKTSQSSTERMNGMHAIL